VACRGGAGGASNDPVFFLKGVGKCLKMQKNKRKKGYDAGHPGYGGHPKDFFK